MTSPLAVRIGHSSRRWNRSIGPRLPSRDSPAASSSLNSKPLRSRCLVNESQPDGAKPQPNCRAAAASKLRSVRYFRAGAASSDSSAAA